MKHEIYLKKDGTPVRYSKEFQEVIEKVKSKQKQKFPSPEEWRDQIIYFIMIDRFNNPDANPKYKENDLECGEFQGGCIKGITDKLDYIKSFGATAIWITPPFKNCLNDKGTYHGYGIQDFMSVDPHFGTEEDLKEMVHHAHLKGMYVIFDIVLNHTGNVFKYCLPDSRVVDEADWTDKAYNILWVDKDGIPKWPNPPDNCGPDECVWPKEFQNNEYFRRQGKGKPEEEVRGDFYSLKELFTEYKKDTYYPVRDLLIKAYQYTIAKYDIDGFRIDTLKYVEREFARVFGNAIREFALKIGKKNFFTFGEVWDDENKIHEYIGRNSKDEDGIIGVDAALDFPLFNTLPGVIKGFKPPSDVVCLFEKRKTFEKTNISSHGDASKYFVTFLDNHDQKERFYFSENGKYDDQLVIGIGALLTLQGIPCIYYGTEQGLNGSGKPFEAVRQALWGKENAFNMDHPFYKSIKKISEIRSNEPALRYGRQYFREVSGNGEDFGYSMESGGILAYSRILYDEEILIVINTNTKNQWRGDIVVDYNLNQEDTEWKIIYCNHKITPIKKKIKTKIKENAAIYELNGNKKSGRLHVVNVALKPMEIQVLKK